MDQKAMATAPNKAIKKFYSSKQVPIKGMTFKINVDSLVFFITV